MGYREIVLTGVLIGSYGPQTGSGGPDFETLVEQIADRCPGARLRISSIEMRQVTDRLIGLMEDGRVVPHLHIPLQSGDTDVLRDMNRPYTQADYLRLVERLHRRVPDFVLTMDVMVGFPTETAERFESTLHVVRETRPLKVHAFRFSPRFGTPADAWGDPIEPTVKQARAEALNALSGEVGDGVRRRFLGRTLRVLVEGKVRRDGLLEGLTDNYVEARFAGSPQLARSFAPARPVLCECASRRSPRRRLLRGDRDRPPRPSRPEERQRLRESDPRSRKRPPRSRQTRHPPPLELFTQPLELFTQPLEPLTQPLEPLTQPLELFTQPVELFTQPVELLT